MLDPMFKNYLLSIGVSENHIIKIELDRVTNKKYYNDPEAFDAYIRSFIKDDAQYYLILDEVQLVSDFELHHTLKKSNH